ncbi:hypothetical protein ABFX02_04G145500 [Erythranthe guttata]
MAQAFLKIVLEKLITLIEDEIGMIMGVDEEMNKLSSTLTTIQSLNDLTYEIDDILDECATEVSKLKRKSSKLSRYISLKVILLRHKIGRRMNQVTRKLDAVAAERANFHLREMSINAERSTEFTATRETGPALNESHHIYGRERDTEKIVDILVNQVRGNEEILILPINGVGGLGKTTLARLVYKDRRVLHHFDKRIWVCVSDDFDLKTLLKAMIESGGGSASDLMHLGSLQRVLWELLNQKRYLLVLDDVWNDDQDKWSQLRDVLACGLSGSSIIVTTRLKKVAEIMRTLPPHYLTGLSEEHCWMLLRERAFGLGNRELSSKLEAIGRQIVNKCSGVPLAAKALGGLLRFKRTEKEWIYRLSYHHLPLALRQCFAYCAVFPKDSRIEKEELIFLWMAHGYISSKRVMEVEDVGEEICNELVLRSLLQSDTDPDTNKPTLIMHDLVHDLARSILENEIPRTQVLRNVRNASYSKIRQVNLRRKLMAFPTSNKSEMDMSFVLTNFFRLRILDASWTGVVVLPRALGKLKHLRHLNLSGTGIRTLPKSLCSLLNLQVLNLDDCKELVALPKKMRYLVNLRHLYLESCTSLKEMPSKIGKLIGLRTLSVFIVGRNKGNRLDELGCLKLCGNLKIRHLERVENPTDAKKANLAEKENLRVLWLLWEREKIASESRGEQIDEKVLEALEPHRNLEYLVIKGFAGRCFPVWMSSPTLDKVVDIYISDCRNCSHLPQLGNLPHLKSLLIRNVAGIEYIIEDPLISVRVRQYFPSLETLHLKSLPNLKGLLKEQATRSAEAFPNLEQLEIQSCASLILPPLSSSSLNKKLKRLCCSSSNMASLSKVDLDALSDLSVEIDKNMTRTAVETLRSLHNIVSSWCIYEADEGSLPEEALRGLNFVKHLEIASCDTVTCLPQGWLRHLTALEELHITSCSEIVEVPEGIEYLNTCLKKLFLCGLPKMVSLPRALRHLSSLHCMYLIGLPQLNLLPEWFDKLTSLQVLYISECPKLASLPANIRGMTNLRCLFEDKCPELERRCERGKGEDWHKIAHIPRLNIGKWLC